MSRQGRRFASNSLHQIAIRTHRVDVKVEDFEIRTVEIRRLPFTCDRHADAVAYSLPQGPGRSLHSGSDMGLGMSRRQASQLPEALDLFHRHCELFQTLALLPPPPHLGEVQHGIKQHGGVAVGQNEAVAIQPGGIGGVVAQEFLPKTIGHWRQPHRRARMAGVGLLYRVYRQGSNRVNAKRVQLLSRCQNLFPCYHTIPLLHGEISTGEISPQPILELLIYRKGSIRRKSVSISRNTWMSYVEKSERIEELLYFRSCRYVLSLCDARVVSCTNFTNCRKLSRSVGAMPSKRTRTPFAGPLRVTTPLSAKP